ncbi:J domain-containing protein [Marinoscillum furvescens]|uniref:DnaJ-like protein n=1 Tax=Marinoscillum furvescens DSM 4134 TaxID=1122208 RepID=A0A3D9KXZ5_MARFU|nr:DnaJ domain-containing protein [Marinoscillum furvescens]RED91755.1 DnaJ-like protein [Marinoscillum furvescens DSM 4134]
MINYYAILGIAENANQSEIKAAFKQMAVKYHPDKHAGDTTMEERFKEVNEAYQVLSNPFEKARYDLQLKYGEPKAPTYTYQPAPQPRKTYSPPPINWRENWVATGYAFAFTFIVATVVMTGIWIKNTIDAAKLQELLSERRALFEQAQRDYNLGKIQEAIVSINNLGTFREGEEDMEAYKTNIFENLIFEAESRYNRGLYTDAIPYYELIENYAPRSPLPVKEHLCVSYRHTDQYDESIKKIKEMLIANYRKMENYLLMAQIHYYDLKNKEEAKKYYEIASDLAIKKYEAIYGDAYPLILSGRMLPESHYTLYTELANIYLETGYPERAIKATRWNINVWPDSASNYAIAARGHENLKNYNLACAFWKEAMSRGFPSEAMGLICD